MRSSSGILRDPWRLPGIGTNPLDADSDDDGLSDGFEVNYASSPTDTVSVGLDTDPLDPDTDTDGFVDGMEVAAGHDPLSGSDAPVIAGTPTPDKQVTPGDLVVVEQILLDLASYP